MTLRTVTNDRLVDGAKIDNLPANTNASLAAKQDLLVSGSNIKTVNGQSLLGSGDVSISGGSGTVTNVSVVSANGLGGTVANPTTTPAITLTTSVNGIVKGNGTSVLAATDGTDYLSPSTAQSEINKNTNLKRMMSTALLGDAVMTINANPAKFDIPSFSAQFVDSYTNPASPTITTYTYPGSTANTITNLATWDTTYISLDKNGVIYQSQTNDYNGNSRDRVAIGSLVHTSRTQIDYVNTFVNTVQSDLANSIGDLSEKIGIITTGNVISANGANLKINKSSGESTQIGLNWNNSKKSPNITVDTSLTAPSFFYTWRNGTGGWTTVTTSDLVPGKYDDGTGGVTQPNGSVATNKWKLDKVYYSPELGVIAIEYGQAIYNSEAEAETARSSGTVQNPATVGLVFRGWIIVRGGATTLNTSSNAVFIDAGKFGSTSGGIGSGSSTTNLQQAYENSVTPQITTDSTRGPVDTKNGSGSDNNKTSRWLNNAGTEVASIDGQGLVKGLNHVGGLTTTATSAGTTTLTVASNYNQQFTGSTTQTVVLPVASTLSVGHSFLIMNRSTGIITVNSSGGNLVQTMAPSSQTIVTCVLASGTTAASWDSSYSVTNAGSGGGLTWGSSISSGTGTGITMTTSDLAGDKPFFTRAHTASGTLTANTTTQSSMTMSRTNTATTGTVTDNYVGQLFSRTNVQNGTGGTLLAQGSVVNITGTDTQTLGTLTPSYHLLKLDPSLRSTGSSIFVNVPNSVVAAPTNGHIYGVIGNTQTVAQTLLKLDTGTSTGNNKAIDVVSHNQGVSINNTTVTASTVAIGYGLYINGGRGFNTSSANNYTGAFIGVPNNAGAGYNLGLVAWNDSTKLEPIANTNGPNGAGIGVQQNGVGGTALAVYTAANVNSTTNGIVNFSLLNTQNGASIVQKVALGSSAQGHTAHQIQMFGASTAQRGITLDTSTTGTGIPIEFITGGTGRTAMKFGTGFTTSTAPTGASTYIIIDIGGTSYKILAQAT